MTFFHTIVYENPVWKWLLGFFIAILLAALLRLGGRIMLRYLVSSTERTLGKLNDLAVELLQKTKLLFVLIVACWAGSFALTLPATVTHVLRTLAVVAFLIQAGFWGSAFVTFWINRSVRRKAEKDPATATSMAALGVIAKGVLWAVVLLLTLDNLGVDVTALIAGLGIGGIALALAVQNILGDLFASLSIVIDKPFVIGDFIIVEDLVGTVERIGLKTTRVRSLSGEQIIFANSDLLKSRIRNYKHMYERRVVFTLGVTYQTPHEKLAAIPKLIREVIESQEKVRFDRAHFKEYGDFALKFEAVYYVLVPSYNIYMDIQQAINLALARCFEEQGIEFAYPTQTLYLKNEPSS